MGKVCKKGMQLPNPQPGKAVSHGPEGGGQKRTVQVLSWAEARPSWRVKTLQMRDPFGWHRVKPRKQQEILKKLGELETMTWSEILITAKKRNHSICVDDLCREAQENLRSMGIGHVKEVVSLRLSGEERVWGHLDGQILNLLWWDHKHSVCECQLRYT